MSNHILGLRHQPNGTWATGVVHARVRHGKAALELRGTAHHPTLRIALESFGSPRRLNGHAGVSSDVLGGTAGVGVSATILSRILADPGGALLEVWENLPEPISKAEWARRSGISTRTIQRVTKREQRPNFQTVRKLLAALQ